VRPTLGIITLGKTFPSLPSNGIARGKLLDTPQGGRKKGLRPRVRPVFLPGR